MTQKELHIIEITESSARVFLAEFKVKYILNHQLGYEQTKLIDEAAENLESTIELLFSIGFCPKSILKLLNEKVTPNLLQLFRINESEYNQNPDYIQTL